MKPSRFFTYVFFLLLAAGGAIWYIISDYYARQEAGSTNSADIVMYKNPGCECCNKWASYMQRNGYSISVIASQNLQGVKAEYGIPREMGACHTALIDGYVIEGHVPAGDIKRLRNERPDAVGLAVPGMPASSPGMNTALNQPYEVFLIDRQGNTTVYSKH